MFPNPNPKFYQMWANSRMFFVHGFGSGAKIVHIIQVCKHRHTIYDMRSICLFIPIIVVMFVCGVCVCVFDKYTLPFSIHSDICVCVLLNNLIHHKRYEANVNYFVRVFGVFFRRSCSLTRSSCNLFAVLWSFCVSTFLNLEDGMWLERKRERECVFV